MPKCLIIDDFVYKLETGRDIFCHQVLVIGGHMLPLVRYLEIMLPVCADPQLSKIG
jgi:hypothetical protein